ncbi:methyltransferase domain-containing protein [Candidatus Skiveiella danica]|uniref:methyltransferase domain-containing protein n=1 Tax=Candidatus Skiveiella danica TaxID=3386177 RepID=UPI001D37363F|nr:methyltransferase domain-containing protein [Betaproteobacteria bacterium]
MTYSSVLAHGSMVFDQVRNGLYAKAMRDRISQDSVVLDLGAGLGVHGLLAAAAGARRVYLVEPEPVLRIAMEVAQANGLQDRVVALQGRIEDVVLPEPVDMIVSAFTGNLLFSEDLLPSLFHARDRYLKPGGCLVPDKAELILAPVQAQDIHAQHVACWSNPLHGLDFSVARRFASNEILWRYRDDIRAERLAEGVPVTVVDMMTATHADCHGEIRCKVSSAGVCHGLLGWIRIRLGDEWLTADPAGPKVHWGAAFLPFDQPVALRMGEVIKLGLDRPKGGDWTCGSRLNRARDGNRHFWPGRMRRTDCGACRRDAVQYWAQKAMRFNSCCNGWMAASPVISLRSDFMRRSQAPSRRWQTRWIWYRPLPDAILFNRILTE